MADDPRRSTDALALLALALQGRPATGLILQRMAQTPRPVLTTTHLLLPHLEPALERAALAHAVAHRLHSAPAQSTQSLKPMSQVVIGALEDARVEQLLVQRLPGTRAWFDGPLRHSLRADDLSLVGLLSRLDLALHDELHSDGNHWIGKARQLFDRARQQSGLSDREAFRVIGSVLAHDLGQMRVRFEPGQFRVPAPYRDDHSFLWDRPNTVAEPLPLTLYPSARELLRPARPATPDASESPASDFKPEPATRAFDYPEWNYRTLRLREDWCTVLESGPPASAPGPRIDASPRAPLPLQLRPHGGRPRRRLHDGEQLDLDAVIDDIVLRRQGQVPSGAVFRRPAPAAVPHTLLILIDSSASTALAADGDHTLLDLEYAAALMLARHLANRGHRVAVHAFNSDTRARVHYKRLLDFGATPHDIASAFRRRPPSELSTRLGAALRHAAGLLRRETGPNLALLVLTDGEPSDVDVHDAQYLIEDARHAAQSARRQGLRVGALMVRDHPSDATRLIFGSRHTRALANSRQLARQLRHCCEHLFGAFC